MASDERSLLVASRTGLNLFHFEDVTFADFCISWWRINLVGRRREH